MLAKLQRAHRERHTPKHARALGFCLLVASFTLLGLLTAPACSDRKQLAPPAQQSFGGAVNVSGANQVPDGGGEATSRDAGRDAMLDVCMPGAQSVPYSLEDPCDQVRSSCALQGAATIALCQSDRNWSGCFCAMLPGTAGVGGSFGTASGFAGAGGMSGGF